MKGWKLFNKRRNGTIGPLFINRRLVIPEGEWMPAEDHPTKGYAHRPGWHIAPAPKAPHLSEMGRVWREVEFEDYQILTRPERQGGTWFLARQMKVLPRP